MSINATNWVLNESETCGNTRLVMLIVADKAGEYGGESWPTLKLIANQSRSSKSTVQRCVKEAEMMGELVVFTHQGGSHRRRKDRRPNLYGLPKVRGYQWPEGLTPRVVTVDTPWHLRSETA